MNGVVKKRRGRESGGDEGWMLKLIALLIEIQIEMRGAIVLFFEEINAIEGCDAMIGLVGTENVGIRVECSLDFSWDFPRELILFLGNERKAKEALKGV